MTTRMDNGASSAPPGTTASEPTNPSLPHAADEAVVGSANSVCPGEPTVNAVPMLGFQGTFVRASMRTWVGSRQLAAISTDKTAPTAATRGTDVVLAHALTSLAYSRP
jgi:hypothetical protein